MKLPIITTSLILAAAYATSLVPVMAQVPKPRPIPPLSRRNVTEIPRNNDIQAQQTLHMSYQDYIVLSGRMGAGDSRDVLRVNPPRRMIGVMPIKVNFKLTGPSLGTPFEAYIIKDINRNGQMDSGDPVVARFNRHNSYQSMRVEELDTHLLVTRPIQLDRPSFPYQVTFTPMR